MAEGEYQKRIPASNVPEDCDSKGNIVIGTGIIHVNIYYSLKADPPLLPGEPHVYFITMKFW